MNELKELLDAIEKRAEAATPGPWKFDEGDECYWLETPEGECMQNFICREDAIFFAAARADVPALVKALKSLLEYVAIPRPAQLDRDEALFDAASLLKGEQL